MVDEAHRLKEPRASRTLALKKIDCQSCFALTGTLIQNRLEEMWSVLDFVRYMWRLLVTIRYSGDGLAPFVNGESSP